MKKHDRRQFAPTARLIWRATHDVTRSGKIWVAKSHRWVVSYINCWEIVKQAKLMKEKKDKKVARPSVSLAVGKHKGKGSNCPRCTYLNYPMSDGNYWCVKCSRWWQL